MTRKAWQFFMANAGGIVGEHAITAAALARAEAAVRESDDYRFRWEPDFDADWSWMSEAEAVREHEVEWCALERRCSACGGWEVVASLGGIFDASADYRRVVEAELSCEVAS